MKIGIDIRPLQGHHKVRGVGMHLKAFLSELFRNPPEGDELVFYIYKNQPNPLHAIVGSHDVPHTVIELPNYRDSIRLVPHFISAGIGFVRRTLTPLPTEAVQKCDVLLAFDFMMGMPKNGDVRYILIGYDLIQIMYDREYFPPFKRMRKTLGLRQALFSSIVSASYRHALKNIKRNDTRLLAISDSTKEQFIKYADIAAANIRTVYLGNPMASNGFRANPDDLGRVKDLKKDEFILFIGGADWRRRIDDLVAAFNQLRGRGRNIKLVLAGFDFQSVQTVTVTSSRLALERSSYGRDIELLGFINDSEKQYLYENALAFVFPSVCEGFGLPILEAMQQKCPVIAYDGPLSSMKEVAGDSALIIKPGHKQIFDAVNSLLNDAALRTTLAKKGFKNLDRFSWERCTQETLAALKDDSF